MHRLTEKDGQGNWCLKGIPWECLREGQAITREVGEKLYGALCKLKDYEDTELSPDRVERLNDFEKSQAGILLKKLGEERRKYTDLEERLQSIYGKCDGLLEKVVESLEQHENVNIPEPVFKAKLLTDGEVDRWEEYKCLEKQGKLLKLPCAVGDTVYEVQDLRERIQPYIVISVHVSSCGNLYGWELKDGKGVYSNVNGFSEYALGKSVFLTREEAEVALKESGDIRQQNRHSC